MKLKLFVLLIITTVLISGCQMMQAAASPSETFKAYVEAVKKKDIQGLKQYLSKGTIKMLEDNAKAQGKPLDEALKADNETLSGKPAPEFRNEKITGDTATLEVKNDVTGTWDELPFAKEDGKWKIAMDKYMEQVMKSVEEQMKKMEESMPKEDKDAADDAGKDDKKDDK